MLTQQERQQIAEQSALSQRLGLGVALSLIPAAGVGSAIAIWIGLRARRQIVASDGRLVGAGMAMWCVFVGALGLVVNAVFLGHILLSR